MTVSIHIPVPENFSFRSTVYSHGWSELAPFELDDQNWRLSTVFSDKRGRTVSGMMSEENDCVRVALASSRIDLEEIERDARHILRLDDDLSGLYAAVDGDDHLSWVAEKAAGRMIRSASVFEDLVKTICTTNCSWGLTKLMVANLVDKLGRPAAGGKRAFPTAEAMASVDEAFYRREIKAGYRSPYFVELAGSVASGQFDPEAWLDSPLSGQELRKEMKRVKGVGDYAADNLLKLVGKYDGLALDSWLRSQFYKKYNRQRPCKDSRIERHYKKYGDWRGLVIWCEMTERWIVPCA
ncbi:MAG: DNA-3-methyladenine glycosylase 2 family protein [Chloracidobacterium sp.]|nr:DNA-3-methyladenine glycosylase 2 family protein [Chloracidobacterium sp.]